MQNDLFDDAEHFTFVHNKQFLAVDLDGASRVLAKRILSPDFKSTDWIEPLSNFFPGPTASLRLARASQLQNRE